MEKLKWREELKRQKKKSRRVMRLRGKEYEYLTNPKNFKYLTEFERGLLRKIKTKEELKERRKESRRWWKKRFLKQAPKYLLASTVLFFIGFVLLTLLRQIGQDNPELNPDDINQEETRFNGIYNPSISADGRFVAFMAYDTFVKDTETGLVKDIAVGISNERANSSILFPAISGDGTYVAFRSSATNLAPNEKVMCRSPLEQEERPCTQIFVRDLKSEKTILVSADKNGQAGNNDSITQPSISKDGRFVAFFSGATNLVPMDISQCRFLANRNWCENIYVKDMQTGDIKLVSDPKDISTAPVISANGKFVAYLTSHTAEDSERVAIFDTQTGNGKMSEPLTKEKDEVFEKPAISGDGRFVAYISGSRIHVYDQWTNEMKRVGGYQEDPSNLSFSGDGRYLAFESSSDLDIYVWDNLTGNVSDLPGKKYCSEESSFECIRNSPLFSWDGSHVIYMNDYGEIFSIDMMDKSVHRIVRSDS